MDKASQPFASDVVLGAAPWVVGEAYWLRDALVDPAYPEGLRWFAPMPTDRGWWAGPPDAGARLRRDPRLVRVRAIVDQTPDPRTSAPRVWVPDVAGRLVEELIGLAVADEGQILAWVRAHGFLGIRARPRERFETIEEIRLACGRLGQAWGLATLLRRGTGAALLRPPNAALPRFLRALRGGHPPDLAQASLVEAADAILPGARQELQGLAPWSLFTERRAGLSGPELAAAFGLRASPQQASAPGVEARLQVSHLLLSVLREPVFEGLLRVTVDAVPAEEGAAFRLQPVISAVGPLATAYLQVLEAVSWPAPVAHARSAAQRLRWRAARQCLHCGAIYRPKRRDQKWCGSKCATAAWHDRTRQAQRLTPPAIPAPATRRGPGASGRRARRAPTSRAAPR